MTDPKETAATTRPTEIVETKIVESALTEELVQVAPGALAGVVSPGDKVTSASSDRPTDP